MILYNASVFCMLYLRIKAPMLNFQCSKRLGFYLDGNKSEKISKFQLCLKLFNCYAFVIWAN